MADSRLMIPSLSQDVDTPMLDAPPPADPKPFAQSGFGRLPNELLERIIEGLFCCDLAAVARISPSLRSLAERALYKDIEIPRWQGTKSIQIYQLNRTISRRADLAKRTREMEIIVVEKIYYTTTDEARAALNKTALELPPEGLVKIEEATIVGNILQSLPELTHLDIQLVTKIDPFDEPFERRLLRGALHHMFFNFDERTAHISHKSLLPNLQCLDWQGDEFHWFLARSPKLSQLHLLRPCDILPDMAPEEKNHALELLAMVSRSSVLNVNVEEDKSIAGFLSHFPALKHIQWSIRDEGYSDGHAESLEEISLNDIGSYTVPLRMLSPVAKSLTRLDFHFKTDQNPETMEFLNRIIPCQGFKSLRSLQSLRIPYQCLFGSGYPPSLNEFPPPNHLLPSSLQTLCINFPRMVVYGWLAHIIGCRNKLPDLGRVYFGCHSYFGDSFELFAFIHHDHPVIGALKSFGIELVFGYFQGEWEEEWDDYDIDALALVKWQESLGPPVSGNVFLPFVRWTRY